MVNDCDQDNLQNNEPRRINRRAFLKALLLTSGAGLLAACNPAAPAERTTSFRTVTPFRALASPQLQPQAAGTLEPDGSISLEDFLALSSLLTGVENLDPNLGQIYLHALQAGAEGPSVADVYSAASSGSNLPQDVDELSGSLYEDEALGSLANTIITMWYTGTYQLDGEDHVATYVDALAWKVLAFTKAPTLCGHFGFWSEEPHVAISPQVQYTPVPTPSNGGQ